MWLRKRIAVVAVVALGGLMAAAPGAFAAESSNASCIGAGSSALAPGQQEDFGPGTRAEVAHFGKTIGDLLGIAPGQLVVGFAHQKGSAEECFPTGPPLP